VKLQATRVTLGLVLALALALAGVPALLPARTPLAPLHGVVIDDSGYALAGARVFLFAEDEARLCSATESDASGEFSFPLVPARPRVLVRAPPASGRLDAFGPPVEDAGGRLAFVLPRARPLVVRVRAADGAPVADAEVRVYSERGEAALVALGTTDARGQIELGAPARAHVAAFAPDTGLARWAFDVELAEAGGEVELELTPATPLRGRVHAQGEALAGIALVLWEDGLAGGWNGLATSDAEGAFELPRTAAPCTLRALDPAGRFLPARVTLAPDGPDFVALELALGARQTVRTTQRGLPLVTRVFAWSPAVEAFGYGQRTNGAGRVELAVAERFAVVALPLDPAFAPLERWDMAPSALDLRLEPQRSP